MKENKIDLKVNVKMNLILRNRTGNNNNYVIRIFGSTYSNELKKKTTNNREQSLLKMVKIDSLSIRNRDFTL